MNTDIKWLDSFIENCFEMSAKHISKHMIIIIKIMCSPLLKINTFKIPVSFFRVSIFRIQKVEFYISVELGSVLRLNFLQHKRLNCLSISSLQCDNVRYINICYEMPVKNISQHDSTIKRMSHF